MFNHTHPLLARILLVITVICILPLTKIEAATGNINWDDLEEITVANASRLTLLKTVGVFRPWHYPLSIAWVNFSPDNEMLAIYSYWSKVMTLWRWQTNDQLGVFDRDSSGIAYFVFSPDSRILATVSRDRVLRLWNLSNKQRTTFADNIRGIPAFSLDGKFIAVGGNNGNVYLWNVTNGEKLKLIATDPFQITFLQFSPDGMKLLATSQDPNFYSLDVPTTSKARLIVWDINTGFVITELFGGNQTTSWWASYARTGDVVALSEQHIPSTNDSHFHTTSLDLWNIETKKIQYHIADYKQQFVGAWFSKSGQYVATQDEKQDATVWDTNSGELMSQFDVFGQINDFNKDETIIANGRELRDIKSGAILKTADMMGTPKRGPIMDQEFSPNGKLLAVLMGDSTVDLWGVVKQQ